jgi:hypothetical protein
MLVPFDKQNPLSLEQIELKAKAKAAKKAAIDYATKLKENDEVLGKTYIRVVTHSIEPAPMSVKAYDEEYDFLKEDDPVGYENYKKICTEPKIVSFTQDVKKTMKMGKINRIVFRGEKLPPSDIFLTGFFRKNIYEEVTIEQEKTFGAISTTKDVGITRRKYTLLGDYIYACWLEEGIDTHDFNKLDEILALHIRSKQVIGCIGPVKLDPQITDENSSDFQIVVGDIIKNPRCELSQEICDEAMAILKSISRVG